MSFQPGESLRRQSGTHSPLLPTGNPSLRAMEVIRSLDSRSFGFLDFQNPSSNPSTSDNTSFVSRELIQQGVAKLRRDLNEAPHSDMLKAEIHCQLGHLHLLLEEYPEALSAYQQYRTLSLVESKRNVNMHYGLGLIYFSIKNYYWAIHSFMEVLQLAPDFARRGEIHLRLGVMFKIKGHYISSIEHFEKASSLSGPASFSKLEIQFHLGHVYYLQGHIHAAKQTFENILSQKNVPSHIKALCLRQLGWLYLSVPEVASTAENPSAKAVDLLKLAVGADPSSYQSWYFLGRCHASQGKAREAFLSYQQAVNKAGEHQAEVWCSIGILYHNMGQAKDSLQSYVCAVYLDHASHEAWTDMGCLYESVSQPVDALVAYKNATIIRQTLHVGADKTGQYLYSRLANLEQYISMVTPTILQTQPHTLPTLKEAWQSLIPSHIKNLSRPTSSTHTPLLDLSSLQNLMSPIPPPTLPATPPTPLPNFTPSFANPGSMGQLAPAPKKQKISRHNKEPIVIRNMNDTWQTTPPLGLTRGLEQAGVPVHAPDPTLGGHDILAQPNSFTASTLLPSVGPFPPNGHAPPDAQSSSVGLKRSHYDMSSSTQILGSTFHSNTSSVPGPSNTGLNHFSTDFMNSSNTLTGSQFYPPPATPTIAATSDLPVDLSSLSPLRLDSGIPLSAESIREYLNTNQEMTPGLAMADLLKSPSIPRRGSSQMVSSYLLGLSQQPLLETERQNDESSMDSPKMLQIAEDLTDIESLPITAAQSSEVHYSDSSSGVSSAGAKFSPESPLLSPTLVPRTPLCMSDDFDDLLDPIPEPFPSLADDGEYMNHAPDIVPPEPPTVKREINLNPEVPIFEVSSREEAMSEKLHSLCCDPNTPVCMVRGLCPIVNLDLELFSSKSIVKACPDHEMEVREQVQQASDENFDPNGRKQVWRCESSRTYTTVREYAKYQKAILQKQGSSRGEVKLKSGPSKKMIRFGTNVDLSDWDKWSRQLEELKKLPKFLRVNCPEANLLAHIGYSILGVNSAQLYMKVPGSRTPGHQENHNLCSVNINIGPGGCEWFSVHNKYWGVFHKLCDKHKLCFLTGSWWPILDELRKLKVPVYQFTQEPGDIVWLNPGTVHWVQANTVCNNIAWNVGPITAHQFRMAWERYRWNKVRNVRSIVPMIHLSWNIAKKVKIVDEALYLQLKSLLESSLAQTRQLTAHLEKASIPLVPHPRLDNETAPCCNHCLEEVFNILFVLTHKGEYLVYCHKCAIAMKKSFTVLRQFNSDELKRILDSFKLHKRPIYSSSSNVSTL